MADELFRALPAGATLTPCTSDELFFRRASLDLVGHLPSPAESAAFVAETVPEKRSRTIERLISDPRFGLNWARYWREVIMARRLATDTAEIEAALEVFLSDTLDRNVAWDQVVRAFIECRGNPRERGEAALFAAQSADPVGVASEASRLFLGVQIQCAQCHDHPTDRWKREQFHEFAAFFARAGIKRVMGPSRQAVHELASFDDGPLARRTGSGPAGAREYFMPDPADPASPGRLMAPVFFVSGQRLQTGASDAERRGSLAAWLTARTNPGFARALVNRVRAELAGEGFSEAGSTTRSG